MSNRDRLNWSADLRRIAWWLQIGNISLANKFIKRGIKLYRKGDTIGNKSLDWWISEIQREEPIKAAERTLTWSLLLR